MKVPALLKNKYVCYALLALATLNIIGYVSVKAWECLALFVLAGYSCYCYCKNVGCSVLAAIFVANFVFGCGRVKEGFEDALKGPVENLLEGEENINKAVSQIAANADKAASNGDSVGAADAEEVGDAAQAVATQAGQLAFEASKATCCSGTSWLDTLTGADKTSCTDLGSASEICA